MNKKAIIFGAGGQDGFFLALCCKKRGIECISLVNNKDGDVRDYSKVSKIISNEKPDFIFHLSAKSSASHDLVFENHKIISTGALNILEATKKHAPNSKVFIVGSGLQFINNELPISEETDFEARDPYSVARIQSVYSARYYRTLGLKVYIGYLFNHDSEHRSPNCVTQKIVHFAKNIQSGAHTQLNIGNIFVKKEWGYAGDIVNGILDLVEQDKYSEAIIGTGVAYSIEKWLELCFDLVGHDWKKFVITDSSYTPEYMTLVSNPTRIMSLGWKPKVDMKELASIMMNY